MTPATKTLLPAIARLYELGAPYERTYGGVATSDPACRLGPPDEATATVALAEAFSREALLEAGVCVEGDESLRLAPALRRGGEPQVYFRHDTDAAPFWLVAGEFVIPGRRPPLEAMLEDAGAQESTRLAGGLMLLSAGADVAQYRLLGLAAAPCAGLGEIREPAWRRLAKALARCSTALGEDVPTDEPIEIHNGRAFRVHKHGYMGQKPDFETPAAALAGDQERIDQLAADKAAAGTRRPLPLRPVLTAWSPFHPDVANEETVRAAAARIAALEESAAASMPAFGVWAPDEADRTELVQLVRRAAPATIRSAIVRSVEGSTYWPSRYAAGTFGDAVGPADFSAARAAFTRALEDEDAEPAEIDQRRDDYRRMLSGLVAPQRSRAQIHPDQIIGALELVAVDEVEATLTISPDLAVALATSVARRQEFSPSLREALRERDRGVQRLLRLTNVLRGHRR